MLGIGVPRFELGTSPTRTERATRLRHTPERGQYGTGTTCPSRSRRRRSAAVYRASGAARAADHARRRPRGGRTQPDACSTGAASGSSSTAASASRHRRARRRRRAAAARRAAARRHGRSRPSCSTHGHDDHIAALAHLIRTGAPIGRIIGLPFTHRAGAGEAGRGGVPLPPLVTATPGVPLTTGAFAFEYVRVAHSIPDAAAVAITTPLGVIVDDGRLQARRHAGEPAPARRPEAPRRARARRACWRCWATPRTPTSRGAPARRTARSGRSLDVVARPPGARDRDLVRVEHRPHRPRAARRRRDGPPRHVHRPLGAPQRRDRRAPRRDHPPAPTRSVRASWRRCSRAARSSSAPAPRPSGTRCCRARRAASIPSCSSAAPTRWCSRAGPCPATSPRWRR